VEKDELVPGKNMNSFEQFCINLCNEKLQNLFVKCVFTFEINQYVLEVAPGS
jgi:myosin heavy subunit